MYFFLPFLSACTDAVGTAFDRLNLHRIGFRPRPLLLLTFLVMSATVLGFILFARPAVPAIAPLTAGIVLVLVLTSFAQNVFQLKGIQAMQLHLREPIINLQPLFTGLLAFLIFPSEGNVFYLFAIVAGVVIVYWSMARPRGHSWRHFFSPGSAYAFADMALAAIVANLLKLALFFMSAAYVALFRIGGVFLLSCGFFGASWKEIPKNGIIAGIVPGILFGIAALAKVFSVQALGLNFTVLVLMLEPGIIYLLSRLMLKEKLEWRPIAGSIVILGMIAALW